jgi:hypothetical protein
VGHGFDSHPVHKNILGGIVQKIKDDEDTKKIILITTMKSLKEMIGDKSFEFIVLQDNIFIKVLGEKTFIEEFCDGEKEGILC